MERPCTHPYNAHAEYRIKGFWIEGMNLNAAIINPKVIAKSRKR